jgi:hypothetical protein
VRLQSWFPFNVFVCVNGREMLAARMRRNGMAFRQRDNCFSWVEDVERAQRYLEEQKALLWSLELTRLVNLTHPQLTTWPGLERPYFWSAEQTEWATDVMFRSQQLLKKLMPGFIDHAMKTLGSVDVMKFLSHHLNKDGRINGHFRGEVGTDLRGRAEGTRVRFSVGMNSVKFYDKQGSVLRVETTINDAKPFKSYRTSEQDPKGKKSWRRMRKGVADLPRRTEVSQSANERCLTALASVTLPTTSVTESVSRVSRRRVNDGRKVRGLNVWGEDQLLLETIGRGEYLVNGFRNRDLRADLGLSTSQMGYRLRLLRAHGVIRKVSGTHRYQITERGRELTAALTKTKEIPAHGKNREILP